MNRQGLPANATFHNNASFLSSSKDTPCVPVSLLLDLYRCRIPVQILQLSGAGVGSAEIIGPVSELNR